MERDEAHPAGISRAAWQTFILFLARGRRGKTSPGTSYEYFLLSQHAFGEWCADLSIHRTKPVHFTSKGCDNSCRDRWIAMDSFLIAARFSRGRLTFVFTTRFITVCRSLANSVFVFSDFTLKPSSSTIL